MKETIEVDIDAKRKYNIELSDESIKSLNAKIDKLTSDKKRLIIISENVYRLYKDEFNFSENELFIMKDGEKEKNLKNYLKISERLINSDFSRNDFIVAIGGGVVGDISGFAASTFMRGIKCIQVPTTLLSMVDSSIGGKTGINFENTKNIIGTFWQPYEVLININFLKTLDKKQLSSGYGEILKYAFIEENCNYRIQAYFFEYLMLCADKILKIEPLTMIKVIEYCLKLKIAVVKADETETGLRKILNFGHTMGHALESITKFKKYTHGEAVVYGIYFIINWACKSEIITSSYYKLSMDLLSKYGFKNIDIKKCFNPEKLVDIIKKDKKAVNNKITFIVPIGKKSVEERQFSAEEVLAMI